MKLSRPRPALLPLLRLGALSFVSLASLISALFVASVVLMASAALMGCKAKDQGPPPPASAAPPAPERLPKLVLKDTTPVVFLTWVSDDGDFHVVQKIDAVPEAARKQVRVVTDSRVATKDWFYVADLSRKNPDGSYPVTIMARAAWDEIGADRRKARLEAQAPSAPSASAAPSSSAAPGASATPRGAPAKPAAGAPVSAIIYGADWCKPCHAAEDYLKQRGVRVVKKDIDNSDAARAEMRQKLDRAGMGGASIPIIDLMGQLLVGYSPAALDRAIASARNTKTL